MEKFLKRFTVGTLLPRISKNSFLGLLNVANPSRCVKLCEILDRVISNIHFGQTMNEYFALDEKIEPAKHVLTEAVKQGPDLGKTLRGGHSVLMPRFLGIWPLVRIRTTRIRRREAVEIAVVPHPIHRRPPQLILPRPLNPSQRIPSRTLTLSDFVGLFRKMGRVPEEIVLLSTVAQSVTAVIMALRGAPPLAVILVFRISDNSFMFLASLGACLAGHLSHWYRVLLLICCYHVILAWRLNYPKIMPPPLG